MKTRVLFHGLSVTCMILLVLALQTGSVHGDVVKSAGPAVQFGPVCDGLQIGLGSEKATFAPGEKIAVTVVVRNSSDHEVWWGDEGVYRDWDIVLKDPQGKEPPLTALGVKWRQIRRPPIYLSSGRTLILKPGEERRDAFVLSDLYDLSNTGKYTLRVGSNEIDPPKDAKLLRSMPFDLTISAVRSP
jgi:hypothetical protein